MNNLSNKENNLNLLMLIYGKIFPINFHFHFLSLLEICYKHQKRVGFKSQILFLYDFERLMIINIFTERRSFNFFKFFFMNQVIPSIIHSLKSIPLVVYCSSHFLINFIINHISLLVKF